MSADSLLHQRLDAWVDAHFDEELRFLQALVRAAVCTFFPIGLAWSVVDPRSRAVHDIVVRSQVVYDWGHREP